MGLTLDIPQELENKLSAKAEQLGVSLSDYVIQVLASKSATSNETSKTGADLVDYWEKLNLVGTHPEIANSQQYARNIRAQAEKRR